MIIETKTNFINKNKEDEKPNTLVLDYVKNYLKITYKEDDELIKDFITCAMVTAENFTSRSIFKKSVLVHVKNIEKNNQVNKFSKDSNNIALNTGLYIDLPFFDLPIKPFYATHKQNNDCIDCEYIPEKERIKINGRLINKDELFFSYISFDSDVYEAVKIGVLMHIGLMYEFRGNTELTEGIKSIYLPYRKVFI